MVVNKTNKETVKEEEEDAEMHCYGLKKKCRKIKEGEEVKGGGVL